MPELSELYQEVIVDHSTNPRHFGKLEGANRMAEGSNPLCGDQITVFLKLEDNIIKDISFIGLGCAISKASASLMTSALKTKTRVVAETLFHKFHIMITSEPGAVFDSDSLGKLAVLAGVRKFPVRVKCASLGWHTLKAALEGKNGAATTE